MVNLITENIDIWTSAQIQKSNVGGRGNSLANQSHYGIKKLRELILELAVHGKLVPQDPNDEPASALLEKIAKEKSRLINEGKIKKQKLLIGIQDNEKHFKLPQGWAYTRNGNLFSLRKGKIPKNLSEENIGLPYLDIEALDRGNVLRYTDDERCPVSTDEDILVVCDGSRSGLVLSGKNGVVGSTLAVIDTPKSIQPYIKLLFQEAFHRLNESMKGAAIPHLDTKNLVVEVIGIPPQNEQYRIIAKVDELMAICDQLEQQQTDSNTAHQIMVDALLNTLIVAANQGEFAEAWQCIAEHFDTLFTTEHSIDQLKQTILQLAVMGKVVPQDPNDESANILLEKIAKEKARLIKEGKIKKQKPLPEIIEDEKPFGLPKEWKWVRFGEVLNLVTDYHANGSYKTLKDNVELLDDEDFAIMLRTTNFSEENKESYKYITERAYNFLAKSKVFVGDIIMNKIGDPGACFFINDRGKPMSLAMNLFLLRTSSNIDSKFGYFYLFAQYEYIKNFAGGTSTQTITKYAVNNLLFPLCPIPEQKKIVAKVDEMIELCDALKARLNDAKTTQVQLADAIVEQAVV